MRTALKIAAALFALPGAGLFAQDFTGHDFRETLANAREELRAGGSADTGTVPVPVDFAADSSAPLAEKEWTVMVFMNGKNNLEGDALADINEMEKAGSSGGVNVIVEVGQFTGDRMTRYYINKDTQAAVIASTVLGTAASIDMGDPASVKDFALWAEKRFPAKKYMLIVWDHGTGWLKGNPAPAHSSAKGISEDWITRHNIDTPQLGRLVKDIEAGGGRVDLLAFDACLMQMVEVAYEMKDTKVSHIAASEEVEPGTGYPYDKWLAQLVLDPSMTAGQAGTAVAAAYLKQNPYGYQGRGLTYSVLEVAKVPGLAAGMDAMARAAMAAGDKAAVLRARAEATRYSFADNKDLRRFAQLLMQYSGSPEVKAAAAGVERLLADGGPVLFSGVSANRPTLSNGAAVYVPENAEKLRGYDELKLSADTSWDEFVNWLLAP